MILTINKHPDKRLSKVAKPVKSVSKNVKNTALNMLKTMYANNGIGLASIQVGYRKRLIVLDTSDTKDNPVIMVNPVITHKDGTTSSNEGCLSVPGQKKIITRSLDISVLYLNLSGDEIIEDFTGLTSICIQHEIDHLNGILFIQK